MRATVLLLPRGQGVAADPGRERALLERGCSASDPYSCVSLGPHYEYGRGAGADVAKAKTYYERACRKPAPRSCWYLGELYEKGKGVTQDTAEARKLYAAGPDGGDTNSAANLAAYYLYGRGGLERDPQRALQLAKAACDSGPSRQGVSSLST